ncbi:hypothetical protein D6S76_20535 [Salmonella enterica subsp. enterica serovar Schwarzengrund]|nr:hypothetical protein [Salmonella enterica subsp. enterica serovar Schwarzengrund]EHK8184165.1 hypothetical protein [Salmonella enterica subsp. enterica serovar Enteritidis]EHX6812847.1 hypothetical protein [Salmonella enterica subsp. enterica serovar Enteritidis]
MTDISALARTLRQAAEDELMCRAASDTSDLWMDEASPENVLALLDALAAETERADEREATAKLYRLAVDAGEKRIAELDKRLIEYAGIATREAHRVAELEKYRTAFMEWHDKTAWVQSDKRFDVVRPLGKHRADVLREYIEHLEARAAQTLTVRVPVRCDCCYSESEAAMFDGVVAEFREKLELACAIAGIKLQIEGE